MVALAPGRDAMTRAFEGCAAKGSSWGFRCPVNGGHRIVFRNARYGHLLDKFNYPVGKGGMKTPSAQVRCCRRSQIHSETPPAVGGLTTLPPA